MTLQDVLPQLLGAPGMLDPRLGLLHQIDDEAVDRRLPAQGSGELHDFAIDIIDFRLSTGRKIVCHRGTCLGVDLLDPQQQVLEDEIRGSDGVG